LRGAPCTAQTPRGTSGLGKSRSLRNYNDTRIMQNPERPAPGGAELVRPLERRMASMTNGQKQAVTGLVPPQLSESTIRVVWPSVATTPAVAGLGRALMRTIVLAPLAWLMLAPFYFKKILPGLGCRYALTNRRLMIQKGWSRRPSHQIALADIDDVRLQ